MKEYYLHNGYTQSGPFDIEDLLNQEISGDTPIWHKGLDKWTFVDQVPGLMQWMANPITFIAGKPSIEFANTTNRMKPLKTRTSLVLPLIGGMVALGVAGWAVLNSFI